MQRSVTIGDRSFAVAELTMGPLRRIPELAPAVTTIMSYQPSEDRPSLPNADQVNAIAIIFFASASQATPELTRAEFDAEFDKMNVAAMFKLITQAPSIVYGDAIKDTEPSPGEAERPSS